MVSSKLFPLCVRLLIQEELSAMIAFLLWCFLFVVCWPLTLLALSLFRWCGCCYYLFAWRGVAVRGTFALV